MTLRPVNRVILVYTAIVTVMALAGWSKVLSGGSAYGAAFPSSHVAGMITASVMSAMGSPRLGLILGVPTVLLTVGVVYCQMHYGVDVVAGVLEAVVVILLVSRAQ